MIGVTIAMIIWIAVAEVRVWIIGRALQIADERLDSLEATRRSRDDKRPGR